MAIRIIKDGDLSRLKATVEFTCGKCGCVFTGDKEDYKLDYSQREDHGWCVIVCPCCGNWITKKR